MQCMLLNNKKKKKKKKERNNLAVFFTGAVSPKTISKGILAARRSRASRFSWGRAFSSSSRPNRRKIQVSRLRRPPTESRRSFSMPRASTWRRANRTAPDRNFSTTVRKRTPLISVGWWTTPLAAFRSACTGHRGGHRGLSRVISDGSRFWCRSCSIETSRPASCSARSVEALEYWFPRPCFALLWETNENFRKI